MPPAIAEGGRLFSRTDNVSEEHGGQHPIWLDSRANTGQKLLDFLQDDISVAQPRQVIGARQLDQPGPRDSLGHITTSANVEGTVTDRMEN